MSTPSMHRLAATLIGFLGVLNAQAATVVFEQAPTGSGFVGSYVLNDPNDPGFNWAVDTDLQRWEYFSVASNVTFNRIGWFGNNADGNFAVDLFSATCFSCGLTPVGGSGSFAHAVAPYNSLTLLPSSGPFNQAQVHKTLLSGSGANSIYSYYVDLGSSVTLDHNLTYGLSVVNNYVASPFAWAIANPGGKHLVYTMVYAGYMVLPSPGDLAFSLTNTNPVPVPEPTSALMLAVGGLLVLRQARRHRPSQMA